MIQTETTKQTPRLVSVAVVRVQYVAQQVDVWYRVHKSRSLELFVAQTTVDCA